jgi:hypothetical protein
VAGCCKDGNEPLVSIKCREFRIVSVTNLMHNSFILY